MVQEALAFLGSRTPNEAYEEAVLEEVTAAYRGRLEALKRERQLARQGSDDPNVRHELMLDVLEVERNTLLRLRNQQRIDDEVLRSLQRELDLHESRLSNSVA